MAGQVGFALAALAVVLLAAPVAHRSRVPSAVLIVAVGLVYGLLPGPNIALDPEVVLTLVLPPLLYSAALHASLVEIRSHLAAVGSLSIGLVLATTFAVAGLLVAVVPDLPFSLAVAVGAAAAPPDPVAALSIGRRAGLPQRLVTLVEGEGLLNDATALTTYQVAVAAAVGQGFSPGVAVGRFALAAVVGGAIGLSVATGVRRLRRHVTDPLVDNGLSLAVPFACFISADAIGGSGVLAVVIAGLLLGQQSGRASTGAARLQARAVWRLVDFLLEGFVFLLIGQQLPTIASGLRDYPLGTLVGAGAATVGAVLLVRPLWLLVTSYLPGPSRPLHRETGELVALSWSGTRGVISLAAIFSLPLAAHGAPLPDRDLLLFCVYAVVLVTLLGQGLTLAPLLRRLHLPTDMGAEDRARLEARLAAAHAGASFLDELVAAERLYAAVAESARRSAAAQVQRYAASLARQDAAPDAAIDALAQSVRIRRLLLDAEREELVRWRDAGRLSERSLRSLERELDLEESRLLPPA